MDAAALLMKLLEKGFQIAGEKVPLGFDRSKIASTLAKLPAGGVGQVLDSLFASSWPSESFFLGASELLGPERINEEHESLLPGCVIVKHGFLCIGSDGGGTMYSFCVDDQKVYLIPPEDVSADAIYGKQKMEPSSKNIKAIAEQSWDSLASLFEWSLNELVKIETENKSNK